MPASRFETLHETANVTTVRILRQEGPLPPTSEPELPPRPPPWPAAPVCAHLKPARSFRVRKEGPNKGRQFFCCARPIGDFEKCGLFLWADEFDPRTYAPPEVERPVPDPGVTREALLARLAVTGEECAQIRCADQRSELWFSARTGRLTASNFGAAAELNKHCSRRDLVRQMLWPHCFTGNCMTRWGTVMEDVCCRDFEQYYRQDRGLPGMRVEESGLILTPEMPWLGTSPDGLVHDNSGGQDRLVALLEIKTPYTLKGMTDPTPDGFYPFCDVPGADRPDSPNPRQLPVPPYYYCQVQGNMAQLGLRNCFFVVWTPAGMQVTRLKFHPGWWGDTLLPRLHEFYHGHYLPAAVAHVRGELAPGCTEPEGASSSDEDAGY